MSGWFRKLLWWERVMIHLERSLPERRLMRDFFSKWKKAGNSNDCKEHKTSSICFLVSFSTLLTWSYLTFSCCYTSYRQEHNLIWYDLWSYRVVQLSLGRPNRKYIEVFSGNLHSSSSHHLALILEGSLYRWNDPHPIVHTSYLMIYSG